MQQTNFFKSWHYHNKNNLTVQYNKMKEFMAEVKSRSE